MTQENNKHADNDTENFAELFQESTTKQQRRLNRGQRIEATIVGIANDILFLDVGDKSEGYINKAELLDQDGNLTVGVGDTLPVYFLSADRGEKLFTTRLGSGTVSTAHLEAAYEKGVPVEGQVEKEIKGGFQVRLSGNVRAFCPYSQMGLYRTDDLEQYIGKKIGFLVSELTEKGRNIILSRRALLEQERLQQQEALQETLREGMTVGGKVTSIRTFGAFVDIGGIDGLIPISEIGWGHVDDINEILHVGQEVEAIILSLDWEKQRIALSLKKTLADPWDTVAERYQLQTCHPGTVSRLTPFGAFVTLEPGVDGLLHISKLGAGRKLNHPREVLESGQKIEVRITDIDEQNKRISLDLAANQAQAAEDQPEEDFRKYTRQPAGKPPAGFGSLGTLLAEELQKKKK
jgi:small subunit ribosomal protein S1